MAKKNNNQVSAVRQAKHGWIWTLAFTVISILWIAPILVVLLNSFKRKAFIFRHPFTLGTEPLSAGWDKFIHGVERAFCAPPAAAVRVPDAAAVVGGGRLHSSLLCFLPCPCGFCRPPVL